MHHSLSKPTLHMPGGQSVSVGNLFAEWRNLICAGEPESRLVVDGHETAVFNQPISPRVGKGSVSAVSFGDDFMLVSMQARFHEILNYRLPSEGWTRLHFRNAAHTSMLFDGIGQADLHGPLCQLLHQPAGVDDGEWIEANVELSWITVFVRQELLGTRFGFDSPNLPPAINNLARGADAFILHNRPVAPRIVQAMMNIFECDYPADLRCIYLEAKSCELACMLAHSLSTAAPNPQPVPRLSAIDIECVHAARRIILDSYRDPPGFAALARQSGINRNKLAYGFRHQFGMSVAEFAIDCRLREALNLLTDTQLPIGLIAERIGYAQPASFSSAFSKRFGITPRAARGRRES